MARMDCGLNRLKIRLKLSQEVTGVVDGLIPSMRSVIFHVAGLLF